MIKKALKKVNPNLNNNQTLLHREDSEYYKKSIFDKKFAVLYSIHTKLFNYL